jgi:hypothetical protein
VAISNANKVKINRMNRAAANVNLGTILQDLQTGSGVLNAFIGASGSYTVTTPEMSASRVILSLPITAKGWIVQARRSGSMVLGITTSASVAGKLMVDTSTLALASASGIYNGDVITYMAFA